MKKNLLTNKIIIPNYLSDILKAKIGSSDREISQIKFRRTKLKWNFAKLGHAPIYHHLLAIFSIIIYFSFLRIFSIIIDASICKSTRSIITKSCSNTKFCPSVRGSSIYSLHLHVNQIGLNGLNGAKLNLSRSNWT